MGRPKKFCREDVLEKSIPVFWSRGFADTSLQDLEKATQVNKSGLYAEFEGKEDIFLQSLKHYLARRGARRLLAAEPFGWENIEAYLRYGQRRSDGQIGCFAVYSMREFAILPPDAVQILTENRTIQKQLLIQNIESESPELDAETMAAMILTFFSGLCMEQVVETGPVSSTDKVGDFMRMIKSLSPALRP